MLVEYLEYWCQNRIPLLSNQLGGIAADSPATIQAFLAIILHWSVRDCEVMGWCRGYGCDQQLFYDRESCSIQYWFESILSTLPHELFARPCLFFAWKLKVLTFSVFPSSMFSIINVEGQGHANLQNWNCCENKIATCCLFLLRKTDFRRERSNSLYQGEALGNFHFHNTPSVHL